MKEFSIEWLLERAKNELKETKDKSYYLGTITHMRELEANIEYMEKLLKK